MSLIRYPIVQYAFVVNDLEAAVSRWTKLFGAGPFFKVPHYRGNNHLYRGSPAEEDVSHCQGQAGPVQIQLTQQHNDAPSIWRDMYPRGKEGLHHVMFVASDFEAEVARFEASGHVVAESFSYDVNMGGQDITGHIAYMDARAEIGCFVEICEDTAAIQHELVTLKALHENWDGVTDPIRLII